MSGYLMNRANRLLLALLVISIFVNYIDRGNLSIAAPLLEGELKLSPAQIGSLLASFFWTYALVQLFGIAGWLADRFPVTLVLAAGYFLWSAATAATGMLESFGALFVMRLVLGAGESVAYPCYSKILAKYFREEQRGLANSLIDAGSKMGPSLGTLIGGYLIVHYGWRMLFVALGLGGMIWLLPWMLLRPRESFAPEQDAGEMPTVLDIVSKRAAWGSFLGHFSANYFWFFLLTWLPGYLVKERQYSMEAMAWTGSIAYGLMACATVFSGWTADRWISRGVSVTRARKTMTVTGLSVSTVILFVTVATSNSAAVALLLLACVGFGIFTSSHWAITQTLAGPYAAGRWTSLQNGFANLAGVAAPWITGRIVQATGEFYWAFVLAAAVALFGACMYGLVIHRVQQVQFEAKPAAAIS